MRLVGIDLEKLEWNTNPTEISDKIRTKIL
jgi:hypothetical protein